MTKNYLFGFPIVNIKSCFARNGFFYDLFYFNLFLLLFSSCNSEPISETLQVDELLKIANNEELKLTTREMVIDSASLLISRMPEDSIKNVYIFKLANRYWNISCFEKYYDASLAALKLAYSRNDNKSSGKGLIYIGDYHFTRYEYDSAYYYYKKSQKIVTLLNDKKSLATINLQYSYILWEKKDYFRGESAALNTLRLGTELKDSIIIYEALNLLAIISQELEDFRSAEKYFGRILSLLNSQFREKHATAWPTTMNNIGHLYLAQGQYNTALKYFNNGLDHCSNDKRDLALKAVLYDNIAYTSFKLKKPHRTIVNNFNLALGIKDSLNNESMTSYSKTRLGEYYLSLGDTAKALINLKDALVNIVRPYNKINQLNALQHLILADPKNASQYAQQYIKISDSLQLEERKMRNKFARIEFETDELVLEKDQAIKEKRIYVSAAAAITLLLSLLLVLYRQKLKQKEVTFSQAQQVSNEEIYRLLLSHQNKVYEGRQYEKHRISRDLHDGIMNRLASTRLNLSSLETSDESPGAGKRDVLIEELKEIESEVRNIAHDLSKELVLGHDSYVMLIENLINQQAVLSDTKFDLEIDRKINWDKIDSSHKINIYRILQETLQNINNHADATKVLVKFAVKNSRLQIEITDDGVGFDLKHAKKGIGIKNIESRSEVMGALFEIQSVKGVGTKIKLVISF